jgi:hypothetical protein
MKLNFAGDSPIYPLGNRRLRLSRWRHMVNGDEFSAVMEALARYMRSRLNAPEATVMLECGQLQLYLMNVADHLDVDLVAAGQQAVAHSAAKLPRLISDLNMKSIRRDETD